MSKHAKALTDALAAQPGRQQDASGPSAKVTSLVYVITSVTVEPGRRLEQTFSFTALGSDYPVLYGQNAMTADSEGKLYAVDMMSFLNPKHQPGVIRGWWREPGSGADGPVVMLDDGPAETYITVLA